MSSLGPSFFILMITGKSILWTPCLGLTAQGCEGSHWEELWVEGGHGCQVRHLPSTTRRLEDWSGRSVTREEGTRSAGLKPRWGSGTSGGKCRQRGARERQCWRKDPGLSPRIPDSVARHLLYRRPLTHAVPTHLTRCWRVCVLRGIFMDECFVFCWYACTHGQHMHTWCPWRVGDGVSGTGVIVCEPPWSDARAARALDC